MASKGGAKALTGVGFVAVGGLFVWGGVTGRLAPMLAALFAPQYLTQATPGGVGGIAGQLGGEGGIIQVPGVPKQEGGKRVALA